MDEKEKLDENTIKTEELKQTSATSKDEELKQINNVDANTQISSGEPIEIGDADGTFEAYGEDDISQIVDNVSIDEKITKSKDLIKKDRSTKNKVWSFIFVVINVVIVVAILFTMLNKEDYTPLTGISFNYGFLALALLCFVVIMFAESWRFYSLIKKSTKMRRPFLAFKTAAYGRYYDLITPFSTGGQPFQAYYMASRGLKASHSVSIPIAKYIVHQLVFAIFSLVVLIIAFSSTQLPSGVDSNIIKVACWIGFGFNFLLVALFIILSVGSFGKKLVLGILKLLHKMKIVKNYNEQYAKLLKTVEEYQKTLKFFSKSPLLLIEMILVTLLYIVAQYCIPYFIYLGLGGTPSMDMWVLSFGLALMIDLAASFIPLPGGSGMAEISFAVMFAGAGVFAGTSFWALLIWRCLTYYLYIVQGLFLVLYDAIYGNKRNKRMQVYFKHKYPIYYNRFNYTEEKEEEFVRQIEESKDDNESTLTTNENKSIEEEKPKDTNIDKKE